MSNRYLDYLFSGEGIEESIKRQALRNPQPVAEAKDEDDNSKDVEDVDSKKGNKKKKDKEDKKPDQIDMKPEMDDEGCVKEEMTDAQKKKREEIVLALKKKGGMSDDKMYAIATSQAMKEEDDLEEGAFSSGALKPTKKMTDMAKKIPSSGTKRGRDEKGVYTAKTENGKEVSRVYEEEQIDEALPAHLQKHFDKDGKKIDGKWVGSGKDRKWVPLSKAEASKKSSAKWVDVTPKGYGPNEEVELEEVWQIDEVSKELKQRYLDKAVPDHLEKYSDTGSDEWKKKWTGKNGRIKPSWYKSKEYQQGNTKLQKRREGIQKVSKELTGKSHFREEEHLHDIVEGMPSSVIKHKERLASISDSDLAQQYGHKSENDLKSMAWRHGYGKGSSHYVDRINKGKNMKEEKKFEKDGTPVVSANDVKKRDERLKARMKKLGIEVKEEEQIDELSVEKLLAYRKKADAFDNNVQSRNEPYDPDKMPATKKNIHKAIVQRLGKETADEKIKKKTGKYHPNVLDRVKARLRKEETEELDEGRVTISNGRGQQRQVSSEYWYSSESAPMRKTGWRKISEEETLEEGPEGAKTKANRLAAWADLDKSDVERKLGADYISPEYRKALKIRLRQEKSKEAKHASRRKFGPKGGETALTAAFKKALKGKK